MNFTRKTTSAKALAWFEETTKKTSGIEFKWLYPFVLTFDSKTNTFETYSCLTKSWEIEPAAHHRWLFQLECLKMKDGEDRRGLGVTAFSSLMDFELELENLGGYQYFEAEVTKFRLLNISVHAIGSEFETALHSASCSRNLEVVKLLIKDGADVDSMESEKHKTPLSIAAEWSWLDCFNLLLENTAIVDDTTMRSVFVGRNIEILTAALDSGFKVNPGGDDLQPLHWAAVHNLPKFAELLVRRGAKIDAGLGMLSYLGYEQGDTALHILSRRNQFDTASDALALETMRILLDLGAKHNAKNLSEETPLDVSKKAEVSALLLGRAMLKTIVEKTKKGALTVRLNRRPIV